MTDIDGRNMKSLLAFQWGDYAEQGWTISRDMNLRLTIHMDNVPFVLKVEIDAPVLTQYGVQPLRNNRDFVLFDLPNHLSSDNELRWRIIQRVDGQDVIQRLVINHQLGCLDGPQVCKNGHKELRSRCCGRVEIGTLPEWIRGKYKKALFAQDIENMAVWILNIFNLTACAFHHKIDGTPAWIDSTAEANAKMKWLSAADSRDLLYVENGEDHETSN